MNVKENEVVGYCLRVLGDDAEALVETMNEEAFAALQESIVRFLDEEAARGDASPFARTDLDLPPGVKPFRSILFEDRGSNGSRRIVAFSFREAASATALQLLGIALAVFSVKLTLAAVPQILGVLRTLWSKVIVLGRPADDDAIDVLETIVRLRAKRRVNGDATLPTLREIQGALELEGDMVVRALQKLSSLAVVEVVIWGGQGGNLADSDNAWAVKL